MIRIRNEEPQDRPAVSEIHRLAFGGPEEAGIVECIRRTACEQISLVALDAGLPVGHILFSPATVQGPGDMIVGMGLAPMAVLPGHQRQGIGSALVREGLKRLDGIACPFIVVLGHPEYYPRFGFEPASAHGLRSIWEGIPDEVFRIRIFRRELLHGITGVVRYRPEFDAAL